MFAWLAAVVVRFWPAWLAGWVLLLLASSWAAPDLDDVVTSGEFAFLPTDSPSRQGEALFEKSWGETVPSRVVIVVNCKADDDRLNDDDRRFIDEVLASESWHWPSRWEGWPTRSVTKRVGLRMERIGRRRASRGEGPR